MNLIWNKKATKMVKFVDRKGANIALVFRPSLIEVDGLLNLT